MRGWLVAVLAATCSVAVACPPPWPEVIWSEVETVLHAPRAAGLAGVRNPGGEYVFSADGRFVLLHDGEEGSIRRALHGRYRLDGDWIELRIVASASDPSTMSAEQRENHARWLAESGAATTPAPEPAEDAPPPRRASAELGLEDIEQRAFLARRLLRVPYRGGEAWVYEDVLVEATNAWPGHGPFSVPAAAWRLPAEPGLEALEVAYADPRTAALPVELAHRLPAEARETRVTALLETPDELEWNYGHAPLHLRLDRGSADGLYLGMTLRGVAPDDDLVGEIVALRRDQALLRTMIERFAPDDPVRLPAPGMRMATRTAEPPAAPAARPLLRPAVTAVALPATGDERDEFVWLDLVLTDAQGLRPGDLLQAESGDIEGSGRVERVADGRAEVRWRASMLQIEWGAGLPVEGDRLVTPAWNEIAAEP